MTSAKSVWLYPPMSPRRARAVQGHLDSDPARALRRHLVNVTRRLLAAHGLGGLTTREIARAAEVSDGVLYNHFADKDELILEALGLELAELGERFRNAIPTPGTATVETNLVAIARACTAFQAGALPLAGALLGRAELLSRFLELMHAGDSGPHQVLQIIAGYLDAEIRALAEDVAGHLNGMGSHRRRLDHVSHHAVRRLPSPAAQRTLQSAHRHRR